MTNQANKIQILQFLNHQMGKWGKFISWLDRSAEILDIIESLFLGFLKRTKFRGWTKEVRVRAELYGTLVRALRRVNSKMVKIHYTKRSNFVNNKINEGTWNFVILVTLFILFCMAIPEIIGVQVVDRQTDKFFDTIFVGMRIFLSVKFATYLLP